MMGNTNNVNCNVVLQKPSFLRSSKLKSLNMKKIAWSSTKLLVSNLELRVQATVCT